MHVDNLLKVTDKDLVLIFILFFIDLSLLEGEML